MVKSNDVDVRNLALNTILTNRKIGHRHSEKRIPRLNWNALKWSDLIDVTNLHSGDPPAIKHLTDEEIQSMICTGIIPDIPDFPFTECGTQCKTGL